MTFYAKLFRRNQTPQTEQAAPRQQLNHAGGFSFVLDDWARLDRFLILGSDAPTYYASARELSFENAACVRRCLAADGLATVSRIVRISTEGRAPKNDPAIFALALASASDQKEVRRAALLALPRVCRTATHLFQFAEAVQQFRGWGRALRNAVAAWYNDKTEGQLAYQVVKYQHRNGWSHRDLMRLAHPAPKHDAIYRWIATGDEISGVRKVSRNGHVRTYESTTELPEFVRAYGVLKQASSVHQVVELIERFRFTHEMIPTQYKNSVAVWHALLEDMPMTAMLRNLGKMSSIGMLTAGSEAARTIARRLVDRTLLQRARVHPLAILLALGAYKNGRGVRGSLQWTPAREVLDALDEGFYASFSAVEPTHKRLLLALDVSGSMGAGYVAGAPGITPRVASAAMAMVTARTEQQWHTVGFSSGAPGEWTYGGRKRSRSTWGSALVPLAISPRQRLDDVVNTVRRIPMGGTDCALPMLYAIDQKMPVDAFVVYTDNETWAGSLHPHQALELYRRKTGIAAKLIVVGMTATEFSIANPDDAGMLDVVGFDTAAPALLSEFIRA